MGAGSGYAQSAFLDDHRLRQHALDQVAQAVGTIQGSVIGRYAASRQDMGFSRVWCLGARASTTYKQQHGRMAALQY
jgi:hypothetical protein